MSDKPDKPIGRMSQREMVAILRRESCIDPRVPLGMSPPSARPERGRTLAEYFSWKHGPDGPGHGRFYPLHKTAPHFRGFILRAEQ